MQCCQNYLFLKNRHFFREKSPFAKKGLPKNRHHLINFLAKSRHLVNKFQKFCRQGWTKNRQFGDLSPFLVTLKATLIIKILLCSIRFDTESAVFDRICQRYLGASFFSFVIGVLCRLQKLTWRTDQPRCFILFVSSWLVLDMTC